jgi:hypothetical protein
MMKKIPKNLKRRSTMSRKTIFNLIFALVLNPGLAFAVTCVTIGDITDCDDGTWIYRGESVTIIEPGKTDRDRLRDRLIEEDTGIWNRDSELGPLHPLKPLEDHIRDFSPGGKYFEGDDDR